MANLFAINDSYRDLLENLPVNEETGEVDCSELMDNEAEFSDKVEAIALFIKEDTALSAALKAEEEALHERRKAIDNKIAALKNYLGNGLIDRQMPGYESVKVKLSFRKSESVEVNEEILDKFYMTEKVTYTPNKTAIKDAIKSGVEVPGAVLVTKQNLQIK